MQQELAAGRERPAPTGTGGLRGRTPRQGSIRSRFHRLTLECWKLSACEPSVLGQTARMPCLIGPCKTFHDRRNGAGWESDIRRDLVFSERATVALDYMGSFALPDRALRNGAFRFNSAFSYK